MLKNKPTDQSDLKMLSTRPVVYWRDLFAVLICTRPTQRPAGGRRGMRVSAGRCGERQSPRGSAGDAAPWCRRPSLQAPRCRRPCGGSRGEPGRRGPRGAHRLPPAPALDKQPRLFPTGETAQITAGVPIVHANA